MRLFRDGPALPVLEMTARHAWWNLAKHVLLDIASHVGASVSDWATLCDVFDDKSVQVLYGVSVYIGSAVCDSATLSGIRF